MTKRKKKVDIFRGILIILVVLGHAGQQNIHDFVFMFHMPLFFILTGFLYKDNTVLNMEYIKKNMRRLILPYVFYMLLILILFDRDFSFIHLVSLVWGGRSISGVYWYMTCLFITLVLFTFIRSKTTQTTAIILILVGGVVAVVESHIVKQIEFLQSPGIPWNADVCLLALVYVAIGFYFRTMINVLFESNDRKYDIVAGIIAMLLVVFCVVNSQYHWYSLDMKPVYYHELLSVLLIPCAFGIVLIRLCTWLAKIKQISFLADLLSFCGKVTIPIMFLHVPLNNFLDEKLKYTETNLGIIIYLIVGMGVPVLIGWLAKKNRKTAKLFGVSYKNAGF